LRSIKNETDKEMVRKWIVVSLWCFQTDPSNRPVMSKVVDMMEGSLESLQIPSKPYLSLHLQDLPQDPQITAPAHLTLLMLQSTNYFLAA